MISFFLIFEFFLFRIIFRRVLRNPPKDARRTRRAGGAPFISRSLALTENRTHFLNANVHPLALKDFCAEMRIKCKSIKST